MSSKRHNGKSGKLTFVFLRVTHFPRCLRKILLIYILPVVQSEQKDSQQGIYLPIITNGKHPSLRYDVAQVGAIEPVRKLIMISYDKLDDGPNEP